MESFAPERARKSLIAQFRTRLLLSIGLLLIVLVAQIVIAVYTSSNQDLLSEQRLAIQSDVDGILRSMVDQESGIRGYTTLEDPLFLEPFNRGRPQYLDYVEHLKQLTDNSAFNKTNLALPQAEAAANDWYNNFAVPQAQNVEAGKTSLVHSGAVNTEGKIKFDRFRLMQMRLQQATNQDLMDMQNGYTTLNLTVLYVSVGLSLLVMLILWRMFERFAASLRLQLDALERAANDLGSGNFAIRVPPLVHRELNRIGQTFNHMADALTSQQSELQDRDVMEKVLELNTSLTRTLDFETLVREFLGRILDLLSLQLAVLYLYDPQKERLVLVNALGYEHTTIQEEFALGEGVLGRTALTRQATYIRRPESDEAEGFQVKTIFGLALPSAMYQVPLMQGKELYGVLGVGSVFSMSENARNVLDIVVSNLTSVIRNSRAFRYIQDQAEELTARSREQELMNSKLKRKRDELTVLNRDLEEANRARSQFLSTMSHELRTPLAAIIGFSQIILRDMQSDNESKVQQKQRINQERILKNGQHLLMLINDVLDLAKVEAGRMDIKVESVDLHELINSLIEETQSIALQQKISVQADFGEGTGTFETDAAKLKQILLNLVSNALKFTSMGSITITASRVTMNSGDEGISIAVHDTGIGISAEAKERIFEAFYQVDSGSTRKFGGTGLGLSIVKQFSSLLGGTLEVESVGGQGSTFTLTLPLTLDEQQIEANRDAMHTLKPQSVPTLLPSSEPSIDLMTKALREQEDRQEPVVLVEDDSIEKRPLILAVDDNLDILNLIKDALEGSHYDVVRVQDPLKVIEMAQELHPCAITLDVMMADLNGWQVLYLLKSNSATSAIPVIMLTVLTEQTTGYVLGADDYLVKPFDQEILLGTLHRLISQKQPVQACNVHVQKKDPQVETDVQSTLT